MTVGNITAKQLTSKILERKSFSEMDLPSTSKNNAPTVLQDISNIKNKKRGINWSERETKIMLEIAIEMEINTLMDGNRYRHKDIYQSLQRQMSEKGIVRSLDQIKIRMKKLKISYINCKKANTPSGQGRTDIPYYDLLDSLYGRRPILDESEGIDTITFSQEEIPVVPSDTRVVENVVVEEQIDQEIDDSRLASDELVEGDVQTPKSKKQGERREGGGRYTTHALLQSFAEAIKKNQEKLAQQNREFLSQELKTQRKADLKLAKWVAKSQEKQTNKLIKALVNLQSTSKSQVSNSLKLDVALSSSSEESVNVSDDCLSD